MKYSNEQRKKETNDMLETLHKNHNNALSKKRIEKMLCNDDLKFKKKKLRKKRLIEFIATLIALLLSLSVLIKLDNDLENDFLNKCIENNTKDYCLSVLVGEDL